MALRNRLKLAVAMIAIAAGVLAGVLPKEWIEESIGFEPDGGSGLVELLFIAVPIVAGALLAAQALRAERLLGWLSGRGDERA
jgi:hypothetical protein